jgi:general secretion pathway protein D
MTRRRRGAALLARATTGAVLTLVLCAGGAWSPAALAQEERITLNLKDAEISALIDTVAEVTGRSFVVDPRVRARITVVSRESMAADELYRVFQSILQVHGFATIPAGEVTKIVPDINAKQLGPEGRGDPALDDIVTRVIPVENVPVSQLVPILRPLIPQQGHFAAYPPTNVLIISDRAANVERLARIIERIDRASDDAVEVVRLENASAAEIVRILESLQIGGAPQEGVTPVKLAADERTNSVLIGGDESQRLRIRTMIAHLDTPIDGNGDTQVIYLRYASAPDLAAVLQGISDNIRAQEGEAAETVATEDSEISIVADEATNSLIISAPPAVQRELESVVRQLDVRRAQVLIEAAIVEVSMDVAAELGFQWAIDGSASSDVGVGGTSFDLAGGGSLRSVLSSVVQEQIPNPGSGLSLAIGDLAGGVRFATLIRALASDSNTNVLSTPSLVTLDNQEAEIRVAENVPFVTGSYSATGAGGDLNPFQTIERRDVGLILKVTPQINEGNSVLLELEQEVSSVSESTQAVDLITNKRLIRTTVLVDSGELVILGGLIDEQVRETEQSVPLLGSIPVLGELFQYQRSTSRKRNLMVFLRPRIIRDADTMSRYASRKYNYIRAAQLDKRQQGVALLDDRLSPVLPPLGKPEIPAPFPTDGTR